MKFKLREVMTTIKLESDDSDNFIKDERLAEGYLNMCLEVITIKVFAMQIISQKLKNFKINHSQWAVPNFIIPKHDKTIRFISDFKEVNKRIKRYSFPMSDIKDLMLKPAGF